MVAIQSKEFFKMERDPRPASQLKILHLAFIGATLTYPVIGYVMRVSGSMKVQAVLPPGYAMIALLPGVMMALAGIYFYRRAREEMEGMFINYLVGGALVEGLGVVSLVVYFLTGGELVPLFSGSALALIVMLMNFPENSR